MFDNLSDKLQNVFSGFRSKGKLTEEDIDAGIKEIRMALLEADVNFKVVKKFCRQVKERCMTADVMDSLTPGQNVVKIVLEEMQALLGGETTELHLGSRIPSVIMLVGLQGSGKTTAASKLAYRLKKKGHVPLLAACDVYRPAAADQLQTLGDEQGVRVFRGDGKHPVEIAKGAVQDAIDNMRDVVIVDTAGRLHVDQDMMDEAVAIRDAVKPDQIFMVVDAMTGQDVVNVVSEFARQVYFDGVIMTKMDGDARGGGALSIREVTGKPIVFISAGEKADTLEVFHPDRMAKRILGMGDVVSVIERAIEVQDKEIEKAEAERLARAQFDFNDFLDIIKQTRKMGGLGSLVSALPGGNKALADGNVDEGELDRIEAIINSMTPEERSKPNMLNGSRRARIARGSGMSVTQVNQLIKRFNETRKQVKKVMTAFNAQSKGKKGKRRRKMRIPGMGNIDFSKFEDMK
ncbi:MAG: signal recognition particle protein [Coriobacteriaceae bacterium]|nr:signal recognition particle protein [Coriobacteriaceae bacterium]